MTYVRDLLYKVSITAKPWPLEVRLSFWAIVLGVAIDGLL
ncbi:MAG: hypothetical protein K0R55_4479 [Sporomusa sp.]|jgi:hypothetical protein|nr:hypothetical protein [Sporomusa sp.]